MGEVRRGIPLLDEAMTAVDRRVRSRRSCSGTVYCAGGSRVCQQLLRTFVAPRSGPQRLTRWLDAQPDLVPFFGAIASSIAPSSCGFHGAWEDAGHRGRAWRASSGYCARPPEPRRRRGDLRARRSSIDCAAHSRRPKAGLPRGPVRGGVSPEPGHALLATRAGGDVGAASTAHPGRAQAEAGSTTLSARGPARARRSRFAPGGGATDPVAGPPAKSADRTRGGTAATRRTPLSSRAMALRAEGRGCAPRGRRSSMAR